MTINLKIKLLTLVSLCCLFFLTGHSTVMGPVKVDIIGFDCHSNSIFFTRTDWSECDCPTELYTYRIDIDSLEINSNWSSRNEYRKNRDEIIKNKGLGDLSRLDTTITPEFILFSWEPEVKYYSKVLIAETVSCPFKLSILGQDYKYYQCSKKSGEPEIINLEIDKESGLILIKYQGDCFEGNWKDSLIFYSRKNGKTISKKLTIDNITPLEFYEMKKK